MTAKYILYTAKRSGAASVEVMLRALGLEFELKDATPWSEPPGPFFDELKTVNRSSATSTSPTCRDGGKCATT